MIMDVRRMRWSLAHMGLVNLGFALAYIGVYFVCLTEDMSSLWAPACVLFVMLFGLHSVNCHKKIKMHLSVGREQHLQVYTIDRPSSVLPPYEESQVSQQSPDTAPEFEVVVDGVDVAMRLAPPLYSQDSSDAPDCTSSEQPPQYIHVERRVQQGEVDA
ncbi:uncharacterized protein PEZ65_001663 [Lycodopsis pacificus]